MPSTTPDLRIEIGCRATSSMPSVCATGVIAATGAGGTSDRSTSGGCGVDEAASADAAPLPARDLSGQNAFNTAPLATSGAADWRPRATTRGTWRMGLAPFPPRPITARSLTSWIPSSAWTGVCGISGSTVSSTTGASSNGARIGDITGGLSSAATSAGAGVGIAPRGSGGGLGLAGILGGNGKRPAAAGNFAAESAGASCGTGRRPGRPASARSMCCN